MIICLLCPLLCGLFFFWKGAKGELSYKSTEKRLKAPLIPIIAGLYRCWIWFDPYLGLHLFKI